MRNRILYIDNLKALAIFSVIIGHVYWFTWGHCDNVWTRLIATFYMPLFFFISGAFAKDTMQLKHLWRKVKQLLLPFFTVGGLYTLLDGNWHELFFGMAHHGYWFLPTLFILFATFYLYCLLIRLFKREKNSKRLFFCLAHVAIFYGLLKFAVAHMEQDIASLFCLNKASQYLLSFYGGYIVFSNKAYVKNVLERFGTIVYAVAITMYVAIFYMVNFKNFNVSSHALLLSFLAIFILFTIFRNLSILNERVQNAISYVGQHTLEIYVLQYFFLPLPFIPADYISGGKFISGKRIGIISNLSALSCSY